MLWVCAHSPWWKNGTCSTANACSTPTMLQRIHCCQPCEALPQRQQTHGRTKAVRRDCEGSAGLRAQGAHSRDDTNSFRISVNCNGTDSAAIKHTNEQTNKQTTKAKRRCADDSKRTCRKQNMRYQLLRRQSNQCAAPQHVGLATTRLKRTASGCKRQKQ